MGFSLKYSAKHEAYIAIRIQIFILFEFRLILLDHVTYEYMNMLGLVPSRIMLSPSDHTHL